MRIVLIHPAFLGDAVFLAPAVRALKARWPGSRLAVVVGPGGEAPARLLLGCDQVLAYDARGADRGLGGLWRAGRRLRSFAPDLAVVSHASQRSGALAWLSGARRRVGYAPFCTQRLRRDRRLPFADRILAAALAAGAEGSDLGLELASPPDPDGYAERLLSGAPRPVVGLVPGAEWATERWGPEKYAVLAERLSGSGATLVLLGGPADREISARIAELTRIPVRDTTGNSTAEALAVLARCDLVVGGDSGLVHCARGLRRPTVMIFGPTDPGRHRFGPGEEPVRLGLDCQPCRERGPRLCPLGHHHCMTLLSADAVADLARGLLDAPARASSRGATGRAT
ncbi:MAG TPA: glycosyltransferase family 9 protein [Anaeromyxobacteraceae bacterium]|nr:glycosyltransferase family 9 protein [Anaeromyxobacteraceae bacterium]